MTLMLHAGANPAVYDELRQLETPEATASHVPIPHYRIIDMLKHTLGFYGHEVTEEHHGITPDGMRYFGLLSLKSVHTGYEDTVGLRNSHDKKFPVGVAFGSRVFVCDNLAFIADQEIKRRHTANAKRDLPGLVANIIEPLADQRDAQHRTFERYRGTAITDTLADQAIMAMYRKSVINVTRIADVLKEWEEPTFEDFRADRTAWRLFNAATFALTGRMVENAHASRDLHMIIDGVCEAA